MTYRKIRRAKDRPTALSRREFIRLAGLAGAGIAASSFFVSCGGSDESGDKETYAGEVFDSGGAVLNIGIWGSVWSDFERENLLNQFETDFNCTVQIDSGPQWYPKLVAAGVDDPGFDLLNQNLPEASQAQAAGFYVPVDEVKANVPNAADLWDFSFDGTGIIRAWSGLGLGYRTDLVDPAPKSWADFWDDRFDGNVRGILTPLNNTFTGSLFMMASRIFGSGYDDTEAGLQAMRDLVPVKLADLSPTLDNWLAEGEVIIANMFDGEAFGAAANGVPASWIGPEEGIPLLAQNVSILKGSKQKRLAYALLNRMCSPEYQEKLSGFFFMRPTNKKTNMPQGLLDVGIRNNEEDVSQVWVPDWTWWNEVEGPLSEEFDKIMQAG